jgi:dihydropyrimidinase
MTRYDTVIRGGKVVTASDEFQCDVAIAGGKIAALGHGFEGDEIIDASGLYVLPGGIDSHVHISQPSGEGIVMADDFESCTRSAAFGGNTTLLPFCLQEREQGLREALKYYHSLAEGQCYVDVSFHLIISNPSEQVIGQELPAVIRDGYTSLKVFMTYADLAIKDYDILQIMAVARETGALVMVHAENDDVIRFLTDALERSGNTAPKYHATSRPIAAEREATHRAITLAEVSDVPLMIVHVSNRESMDEIRRAQEKGLKIFGETCPQYLMLTADDLDGLNMEGAKLVCSPPPRDTESQAACWEGIEQGVFSVFSSDHCPFRYEDPEGKLNPKARTSFRWVPNGIPGVAARLPILFSEGVVKGRISINRFVELTSTNHAKIYGLYPRKGTIMVGADADIAIWDPKIRQVLTHSMLKDGSDYTPYEGREITGWPVRTMVRGKTIVNDGKLIGKMGYGKYLGRNTSSLAGSGKSNAV